VTQYVIAINPFSSFVVPAPGMGVTLLISMQKKWRIFNNPVGRRQHRAWQRRWSNQASIGK